MAISPSQDRKVMDLCLAEIGKVLNALEQGTETRPLALAAQMQEKLRGDSDEEARAQQGVS